MTIIPILNAAVQVMDVGDLFPCGRYSPGRSSPRLEGAIHGRSLNLPTPGRVIVTWPKLL